MKTVCFIAALLFAGAAHAATDEECSQATNIAVATFKARKDGLTEDMAMKMLRDKQIYSGLPVWAVKQALRAPIETPELLLRGMLFGECRKREE